MLTLLENIKRMNMRYNKKRGSAMIMVLMTMAVIIVVGTSMLYITLSSFSTSIADTHQNRAYNAALVMSESVKNNMGELLSQYGDEIRGLIDKEDKSFYIQFQNDNPLDSSEKSNYTTINGSKVSVMVTLLKQETVKNNEGTEFVIPSSVLIDVKAQCREQERVISYTVNNVDNSVKRTLEETYGNAFVVSGNMSNSSNPEEIDPYLTFKRIEGDISIDCYVDVDGEKQMITRYFNPTVLEGITGSIFCNGDLVIGSEKNIVKVRGNLYVDGNLIIRGLDIGANMAAIWQKDYNQKYCNYDTMQEGNLLSPGEKKVHKGYYVDKDNVGRVNEDGKVGEPMYGWVNGKCVPLQVYDEISHYTLKDKGIDTFYTKYHKRTKNPVLGKDQYAEYSETVVLGDKPNKDYFGAVIYTDASCTELFEMYPEGGNIYCSGDIIVDRANSGVAEWSKYNEDGVPTGTYRFKTIDEKGQLISCITNQSIVRGDVFCYGRMIIAPSNMFDNNMKQIIDGKKYFDKDSKDKVKDNIDKLKAVINSYVPNADDIWYNDYNRFHAENDYIASKVYYEFEISKQGSYVSKDTFLNNYKTWLNNNKNNFENEKHTQLRKGFETHIINNKADLTNFKPENNYMFDRRNIQFSGDSNVFIANYDPAFLHSELKGEFERPDKILQYEDDGATINVKNVVGKIDGGKFVCSKENTQVYDSVTQKYESYDGALTIKYANVTMGNLYANGKLAMVKNDRVERVYEDVQEAKRYHLANYTLAQLNEWQGDYKEDDTWGDIININMLVPDSTVFIRFRVSDNNKTGKYYVKFKNIDKKDSNKIHTENIGWVYDDDGDIVEAKREYVAEYSIKDLDKWAKKTGIPAKNDVDTWTQILNTNELTPGKLTYIRCRVSDNGKLGKFWLKVKSVNGTNLTAEQICWTYDTDNSTYKTFLNAKNVYTNGVELGGFMEKSLSEINDLMHNKFKDELSKLDDNKFVTNHNIYFHVYDEVKHGGDLANVGLKKVIVLNIKKYHDWKDKIGIGLAIYIDDAGKLIPSKNSSYVEQSIIDEIKAGINAGNKFQIDDRVFLDYVVGATAGYVTNSLTPEQLAELNHITVSLDTSKGDFDILDTLKYVTFVSNVEEGKYQFLNSIKDNSLVFEKNCNFAKILSELKTEGANISNKFSVSKPFENNEYGMYLRKSLLRYESTVNKVETVGTGDSQVTKYVATVSDIFHEITSNEFANISVSKVKNMDKDVANDILKPASEGDPVHDKYCVREYNNFRIISGSKDNGLDSDNNPVDKVTFGKYNPLRETKAKSKIYNARYDNEYGPRLDNQPEPLNKFGHFDKPRKIHHSIGVEGAEIANQTSDVWCYAKSETLGYWIIKQDKSKPDNSVRVMYFYNTEDPTNGFTCENTYEVDPYDKSKLGTARTQITYVIDENTYFNFGSTKNGGYDTSSMGGVVLGADFVSPGNLLGTCRMNIVLDTQDSDRYVYINAPDVDKTKASWINDSPSGMFCKKCTWSVRGNHNAYIILVGDTKIDANAYSADIHIGEDGDISDEAVGTHFISDEYPVYKFGFDENGSVTEKLRIKATFTGETIKCGTLFLAGTGKNQLLIGRGGFINGYVTLPNGKYVNRSRGIFDAFNAIGTSSQSNATIVAKDISIEGSNAGQLIFTSYDSSLKSGVGGGGSVDLTIFESSNNPSAREWTFDRYFW